MTFNPNVRALLKPTTFSIPFRGMIHEKQEAGGDNIDLSFGSPFTLKPPRLLSIRSIAVHFLEGDFEGFSYIFNNCATYSVSVDGIVKVKVDGCSMVPYKGTTKRRDELDCFLYKLKDRCISVPTLSKITALVCYKHIGPDRVKGNSSFAVILNTIYGVPVGEDI